MAAAGRTPPPERLDQASTAIRDSDDAAAQALYEDGGGDAVVERMIKTCGLTDTSAVDGRPEQVLAQGVAIKNGWTPIADDGMWHVNCLTVGPDWVLAVLMRYPIPRGLDHGAQACAGVARRLVASPTGG